MDPNGAQLLADYDLNLFPSPAGREAGQVQAINGSDHLNSRMFFI